MKSLIGEPLSDMYRFAGIQVFEFGVQRPGKNRKGEEITFADRRLHVSCRWCITGPEGNIVSSMDFGPNRSRHDERASPFYEMLESEPPVVEALKADESGAIVLRMSRGYTLEVQPDEGEDTQIPVEHSNEQWRFLPKDKRRHHLVITSRGIET